jgi:pimeloyl-ACP methyl ester carboxylesterase
VSACRRLVVPVVAALALVAAGSPGRGSAPRLVDPHACPELSGFTCSLLVVPLDHHGRQPGVLRLKVAVADNADAPRGVLLFLAGGPGQPAVPSLARIANALTGVRSDYRLVVYDQRGTGAGALECPALQRAMGSSDLYPPPATAVRACARAIGATRALYGTDDVVADMELLREAMGADRWALDGVSYGTFVAERYTLEHPGRVSRLVLDSVVPHDAGYYLLPIELRAAARVLRRACAGPGCSSDPAADLAAVVRRHHDGPALLDALTLISIVDPTFRQPLDVPDALRRARRGDPTRLEQLLLTARRWEAAPAEGLSQGLHASALCADWRFPWGDSDAPVGRRAAKLASAVARLAPRETWPFDGATALHTGLSAQCLPWPPTRPTPTAGARLPAVPTLLLAGGRDLSTPLEWARREAELAPSARLLVVHGAGHDVQIRARSDAGRNALAAFLNR